MVRRNNSSTMALALGLIAMTLVSQCNAYGELSVGFYTGKCKNIDVEIFIREKVESAFKQDPTLVAAMLRMLFHDCFVRVCYLSHHLYNMSIYHLRVPTYRTIFSRIFHLSFNLLKISLFYLS